MCQRCARGAPYAASAGARAGSRSRPWGIGPRSDGAATSRLSPPARSAGRNGRAITPAPIGRCVSRARSGGSARAVCRRVSRIARRATDSSPQVGICCYRLPVAVCIDCGRERPCYWATTGEPVCLNCTAVRRAEVCVGCGERRVAHRRVAGGILCQTCDIKHGSTTRACERCGQIAPLLRGVCAACQLGARVDQLAAGAGPDIASTLARVGTLGSTSPPTRCGNA
jgi:hypothetical protein